MVALTFARTSVGSGSLPGVQVPGDQTMKRFFVVDRARSTSSVDLGCAADAVKRFVLAITRRVFV